MTTVVIDQNLALDLIRTKKHKLDKMIQRILDKWRQPTADRMIELTRAGELPEAENDAIALTNLIDKIQELEAVLQRIESEKTN